MQIIKLCFDTEIAKLAACYFFFQFSVSVKLPLDMDEVITLGDSSSDEDDVEIVEEKKLSNLDAKRKMAKEQLEDMVKKRLEEVVMAKLQRQNIDLLAKGGNFKLNLISRRTGKPVTFNMVDLDRINNCSVSRIINHNGVELGKDWIRKTHSAEEHKDFNLLKSDQMCCTKKRGTELIETEPSHEYLSVENLKIMDDAPCIPNENENVVTLNEDIEDDLGHGLQEIVRETFQAKDEQDMLNAMDLDLDIEPDISHELPMMSDQLSQSGFHQAFAYLSSLPPHIWSEVERTDWTGCQRRGVEDEIFGGSVRTPGWGVLQPEQSLTRPASLEEVDPDLHQSLESLEAQVASLEGSTRGSIDDWNCGCKVKIKFQSQSSEIKI